MVRFAVIVVVVLFLVAPDAAGQTADVAPDAAGQTAERRLPPTFRFLRPWEPGETPPPVDPNDTVFDELLAAMRAWTAANSEFYLAEDRVFDCDLAEQLIGKFYIDHGHPNLNWTAQGRVVDILGEVSRLDADRLPDDARSRLAAGLLEYLHAGGGRSSVHDQLDVAEALDRLAPDDPVAQSVVDELLVDTLEWAEAVPEKKDQRMFAQQACRKRWGDSFPLLLYEIRTRGLLSDVPTPPSRYEKAVAALRALGASPPADHRALFEALRNATEMALRDFKEPVLNDDLTCRLLIAYRALLARRPPIHARAVAYIEDQLLRLASKSKRLSSERHWELWSRAAREVGIGRVSKRFQDFLRRELERKDLPEVQRKHWQHLRPLLEEEEEE